MHLLISYYVYTRTLLSARISAKWCVCVRVCVHESKKYILDAINTKIPIPALGSASLHTVSLSSGIWKCVNL